MATPMALNSDLVDDSKLRVRFSADRMYTYHEIFQSHHAFGQQLVRRQLKEEVWKRGRDIGKGASGKVWLEQCINSGPNVQLRAVKMIPKSPQSSHPVDYTRELAAMAKFSQQKYEGLFVKSFGWYEDLESVYIAMEYFEFGDLQKYLGQPLPEVEVQQITSQVLEGLDALHSNGYAHRDLKPANLFVVSTGPQWWVKIGDFGISKRVQNKHTKLQTVVGTVDFLAPEVLKELHGMASEKTGFEYTHTVDIWSVGVIAFYMLTGRFPFERTSDLWNYIRESRLPTVISYTFGVNADWQSFFCALIAADPAKRLSAQDALRHPWFRAAFNRASAGQNTTHMGMDLPLAHHFEAALTFNSSQPSGRWSALNETVLSHQGPVYTALIAEGDPIWDRPSNPLVHTVDHDTPHSESGILTIRRQASDEQSDGEGMEGLPTTDEARDMSMVSHTQMVAFKMGLKSRSLIGRHLVMGKRHTIDGWAPPIAFSSGGQLLVVACENVIHIWNIASGELVQKIYRLGDITRLTFSHPQELSPSKRLLAASSEDGSVQLWYTATWKPVGTFREHTDIVTDVAFSTDGNLMASSSHDCTVRVRDLVRNKSRTLLGHDAVVSGVLFSPDGSMIASCSWDRTVRIWDSATLRPKHTLSVHTNIVLSVAFSLNSQNLFSISADNTIRSTDTTTWESRPLMGTSAVVLTYVPYLDCLAIRFADEHVYVLDAATGSVRGHFLPCEPGVITAMCFPDGDCILRRPDNFKSEEHLDFEQWLLWKDDTGIRF